MGVALHIFCETEGILVPVAIIYLFLYLSYSKYSDFVDNRQTTKNIAKRDEQSTVPNVQSKQRVSNILTYDIILVNISSSLQHRINNSCYT